MQGLRTVHTGAPYEVDRRGVDLVDERVDAQVARQVLVLLEQPAGPLDASREASRLLEEHEDLARNLGVNALVDQIHSSAVDLIGGTGMDRAEALHALQEATGRASW
jgi:hypothetical protein